MIPVAAYLDMTPAAEATRVEVRVVAETPRPLRWTLVIDSQSAGGTSHVSQGGTTDGTRAGPLASVVVGPNAKGSATLSVDDAGAVTTVRRDLSAP